MTTRRKIVSILTSLAAAVGLKAAAPKRISADPMPDGKSQPVECHPFDEVSIGMCFWHDGRRYGLCVPVAGEIEEYGGGDRVVIMTDDQVLTLIRMLQELRASRAESLRALEAGEGLS